MRTGPRILVTCLVLLAALSAPAYAADTLTLFTDNAKVALGAGTMIGAHAETDAGYGGGHIAFKYKPIATACAATPADDEGADAGGGEPAPVDAGPSVADVGGQIIQLGLGTWQLCAWLVDDVTGATVAIADTVVTVVPYIGSLTMSLKRAGVRYQVVLSYSTSGPARLFAILQKGARTCPKDPAKISRKSVLILPRTGRLVGSDGGLGRSIDVSQLAPGKWRACGWLKAEGGGAGPATRTFVVPRPRAGHAAG